MTDYDEIKAMNWSSLKHLATSPLQYKHVLDNPQPDKPAFALGRCAHVATLQPELLESSFGVYEGTHDKRHKAFQEWMAEHPGVDAVKQDVWDTARAVRDSVHANADAHALLTGGLAEEVVTWDPGQMPCKSRLDYLRPDCVVDLKTSRDITPRSFFADMARYMYHGQLAYYHDGATVAKRIKSTASLPFVVAVETEPPYDVGVFQLSVSDYGIGVRLYERLLNRYADCVATDWWPGKVPTITQTDLPRWSPGAEEETDGEEFE